VASEEDFEATLRDHSKPILGWHPNSEHAPDIAQTRAAMRALGIGRITITPTESGWTFQGDGSLAGLVKRSGTRRSGGAAVAPPDVRLARIIHER
jgi:hypothetical protein